MSLSGGAAIVRFGMRLFREDHAGLLVGGILLYLLLFAAAAWLFRQLYLRLRPARFAGIVLVIYFLVQVALILAGGRRLHWQGDAALLNHYVQTLSAHGYAPDTLSSLSDAYDYRVWSRRALPFYLLIHRAAGGAFQAAVQGFSALVMTMAAWLTWRLAMVLWGPRVAAIALVLHVVMPWRLFTHLDLSHHVLGSFYYTIGIWILVEWHQPRCTRIQRTGLALASFILLPLMRLEGGIDFVLAGAVALTLLVAWAMGQSTTGQTVRAMAVLLVLPWLAAGLLVGPLDARLDAADPYHYDTGILAWSTRGWSVDTGGEYFGNYEQVDTLTPLERKKEMMFRIIASQVFYNPAAVAFRQLPIKATKFFMAGYASGFEETLRANQLHRLHQLHVGARTAYLLLLLPLAIGGAFVFLAWIRRREALYFLLPCAVLAGAYVVFGESDPRYSVYLHTYYFLSAGAFIAWLRESPGPARQRGWRLIQQAIRPSISLLLIFGVWVMAVYALRPWLNSVALWDMRQVTVDNNRPLPVTSTLAPFEIHLPPATRGPTWGILQLPSHVTGTFSFYILPMAGLSASRGTPILLRQETAEGWQDRLLSLPARVVLDIHPGDSGRVELQAATDPPPFPIMLGYATYEFD